MKQKKALEKMKAKEEAKATKVASQQLPYIQYTGIKVTNGHCILESKDNMLTAVFKINGMNLSNITDRDMEYLYVTRLLRCISFIKKGYIKSIEVPLSFSRKLDFCEEQIAKEQHPIKKALWEDDKTLFQVLDKTKEKSRSFFLFIEDESLKELQTKIKSVSYQLKHFGVVLLDGKQLTEIVTYINNAGGIAPAFETI